MKIDVHTHTRKTKSGDAKTREINAQDFCKVLTSTDVKILAITNHNLFDLQQYKEIYSELDEKIQIWPGVELDIVEDLQRAHLLVIVSPKRAEEFSSVLASLTAGSTPDTFSTNIDTVIQIFDGLGPLYIAHYHQKKPDLSDEQLDKIIAKTKNKNRVIKEVANAISAGIFIEHGHASIYGSDVQDWKQYSEISKILPELRLPVESFEHFCLLLEKDQQTIQTILDKKSPETLMLQPFEDDSQILLKCYNDINILFGSKGTGKTKILRAIEKYYNEKGMSAKFFTTSADKLEDLYDIKGSKFTVNLDHYGISFCGDQISKIKNATEEDVTNLDNYVRHFKTEITNKNAKKILLKDCDPEDENEGNRQFKSYYKSLQKLDEFSDFIETDVSLKNVASIEEIESLKLILKNLRERLKTEGLRFFIDWKKCLLLNNIIAKIKSEVSRKTGAPAKPSNTGFSKYAKNRIDIELNAKEILANLDKSIKSEKEHVGSLGKGKGELFCKTEVIFQDGKFTNSRFSPVSKINKKTQKSFAQAIQNIADAAYEPDVFEYVSDLNDIEGVEEVTSLSRLLLFRKYFVVDDEEYQPSSGESSMLLLHKELEAEKDVYILDEPEKSLGNDYISDEIVPLINDKAKRGKRIFISTHDANIAVRTLPYNSIYRTHGSNGYKTYLGNPFSNDLVNIIDQEDRIDWKQISMKTLEGGKEAFGERGKIYGDF